MATFKLSVFSDEITSDFGRASEVAANEFGLGHVELRILWGKNIMALDAKEVAEARRLLERAVDALPDGFRVVFVLREMEGCSVEETAAALGIRAETVKTRLHRARGLLRKALDAALSDAVGEAFPFLGARWARITEAVIVRVAPQYGWGGDAAEA